MNGVVTEVNQEIDSLWRKACIREKAPRSVTNEVQFVLGKSCRVGQRLPHVVFFQVRQFLHDLCRRHAVGDKVHDMGDRNAEASDGGSPGQDIGILCNPVERLGHGSPALCG